LVLLLAASAACGGGSSPSPDTTGTPLTQEEASRPSVEITYPEKGADPVTGGEVLVALTVRSFSIVDKIGKPAKAGEGHLVYYLDVDKIPTEAGKSALVKGAGESKASAMTSQTWKHVKTGRHTLGVQLVNNDDTPLSHPATDEIEVKVAKA
jgi:hypothetical protein